MLKIEAYYFTFKSIKLGSFNYYLIYSKQKQINS